MGLISRPGSRRLRRSQHLVFRLTSPLFLSPLKNPNSKSIHLFPNRRKKQNNQRRRPRRRQHSWKVSCHHRKRGKRKQLPHHQRNRRKTEFTRKSNLNH